MIASYHRITQVRGDLGRCLIQPPTQNRGKGWVQTRVLRAFSSCILETSRDGGDAVTSLDSLFHSVLNYPQTCILTFSVSIQKIFCFNLFLVLILCTSATSLGPSFLRPLDAGELLFYWEIWIPAPDEVREIHLTVSSNYSRCGGTVRGEDVVERQIGGSWI